jgi:uncharacterized membrane protein
VILKAIAIAAYFVVASFVFLAGDAIVIPLVMRPLFKAALGDAMLEMLRLGPAALFYAIHMGGLIWFAGLPALRAGNAKLAFFNGAALGFVTYSCYEMTSWTIMRDWHAGLVVIDVTWGTLISGLSSLAGYFASKWVA